MKTGDPNLYLEGWDELLMFYHNKRYKFRVFLMGYGSHRSKIVSLILFMKLRFFQKIELKLVS